MMILRPMIRVFVVAMFGPCHALYAHHSVLVFETSEPVILKGHIVDVKFANPHSAIFIDVADSNGEQVRWAVENSGTLAMTKQRGFDQENLKIGDAIEVCGYAPKSAITPTGLVASDRQSPATTWWEGASKLITGRLLILKSGPAEHWSHYGPLEACQALLTPK